MRAIIIAAVLSFATIAHAYPQFQMSRDQTCSSCHLSPAGGGLLSENGLILADTMSQWPSKPGFIEGKVSTPKWLVLGGDTRWAIGYQGREPKGSFVWFPMQAELHAAAYAGGVSLQVTGGLLDPATADGTCPAPPDACGYKWPTLFGSREHYVMWQQNPGEPFGMFVRAGRFMPVYGLRFVEHPTTTRQYGGSPLYSEAYAVAAEYIAQGFEVHATGFVHDPLQQTVEIGNGAALYAEARAGEKTAFGVESKLVVTKDDRKEYFGATAKHYFESPGVLIQGEAEIVHDKIAAGGTQNGAVAYALGTYFLGALMVDLGAGYYTESLEIRYLDQEAMDLNIHWFPTSHAELVVVNRLQMLEFGAGGLTSGYSLLLFHYRL